MWVKNKLASCLLLLLLILASACSNRSLAPEMSVSDPQVNYLQNPLGLDAGSIRFSWKLKSDAGNKMQSAYQIQVATTKDLLNNGRADRWDSGQVISAANKQVSYQGKPLADKTTYYWRIRSWDEQGEATTWSEIQYWATGLKTEDWKAQWIAYPTTDGNTSDTLHMPGAALLRKAFQVNADSPVKRATVYATALGVFELYINGRQLGSRRLAPGWTDYDQRLYYLTYEVPLAEEQNVVGAVLADGWYSGHVGPRELRPQKSRELYGAMPALRLQLEIEYENGDRQMVLSDTSWSASSGPIRQADILMGETYDARLEIPGWHTPGFAASDWDQTVLHPGTEAVLQAYPGPGILTYDTLAVQQISEPAPGLFIFDFGQNFSGVVELTVSGDTGDSILMRHGEMLYPDGRLMTENLRFARATDSYILKGEGEETWHPSFTYHGFRYVEIRGLKEAPQADMLKGIAFSSTPAKESTFLTSDTLINRIYENILWTQRSNFMDVPTDSPQRDERLGWLGDAQIFSKSALFNAQLANFNSKWLQDVADAQIPDGRYPVIAPNPYRDLVWTSPGWMEAGIIVPYYTYRFYADTALIGRQYASMARFMDYHLDKTGELGFYPEDSWSEANPRGGFGDWLELTEKHSAHDILASFYLTAALAQMTEMSKALGKQEDTAKYRQAWERARKAITEHFLDEEGRFRVKEAKYGNGKGYFEGEKGFTGHTQSIYASAFYFDILDSLQQERTARHFEKLVIDNAYRPTSGILGVRQLLPGLAKAGYGDLAYRMLCNTAYPGWGFSVEQGATTIWERWNSYTPELGFNGAMNAKMNSFNHYAFGAVGEFLFNYMAGIQAAGPGFDQIIIRPELGDYSVREVQATYESMNGTISSAWQITADTFSLEVEIPVNSSAQIYIPVRKGTNVREGGEFPDGFTSTLRTIHGKTFNVYSVGSGHYTFQSELPLLPKN